MMKANINAAGCLVVTVRSPVQATVGALGLLFMGWLAYEWLGHRHNDERMLGLAGAIFTCMVFLAVYERSDFCFDARHRLLSWSRRMGPLHSAGQLHFDQIRSVSMETAMGQSRYYPKHRVVLQTASGVIPLKNSYQNDEMNAVILEKIRAYLDMPADPDRTDSVFALIAARRDIEAIKLLRETRHLSLNEAHAEVARIRSELAQTKDSA